MLRNDNAWLTATIEVDIAVFLKQSFSQVPIVTRNVHGKILPLQNCWQNCVSSNTVRTSYLIRLTIMTFLETPLTIQTIRLVRILALFLTHDESCVFWSTFLKLPLSLVASSGSATNIDIISGSISISLYNTLIHPKSPKVTIILMYVNSLFVCIQNPVNYLYPLVLAEVATPGGSRRRLVSRLG